MTSPLLTAYGRTAELARGLKWVDEFESNETVLRNGGTITGAPTINNGATLDGTNDYLVYDTAINFTSGLFSVVIEFTPEFAVNDGNGHYIFDSDSRYLIGKGADGRLVIYCASTIIALVAVDAYEPYWLQGQRNVMVLSSDATGDTDAWLNANAILTNDGTTWTPTLISSITIGARNATYVDKFIGEFHSTKLFEAKLTDQEALDYCNRTTWRYRENTKFYLPMRAEQHDPVNVRTLDASGNGNHFQLGDGSTPATYPAKLARRGYEGDGSNTYLVNTSVGNVYNSDFSFEMLISPTDDTIDGIFCCRDAFQDGVYAVFRYADREIRVSYNTVDISSSIEVTLNNIIHVMVVYDVSGDMILYINGEPAGSGDISGETIDITTSSLFLMCLANGTTPASELGGRLFQSALYTKALTPTQVLDCYLDMIGRLQHV